jgi:hypothetical protein
MNSISKWSFYKNEHCIYVARSLNAKYQTLKKNTTTTFMAFQL